MTRLYTVSLKFVRNIIFRPTLIYRYTKNVIFFIMTQLWKIEWYSVGYIYIHRGGMCTVQVRIYKRWWWWQYLLRKLCVIAKFKESYMMMINQFVLHPWTSKFTIMQKALLKTWICVLCHCIIQCRGIHI